MDFGPWHLELTRPAWAAALLLVVPMAYFARHGLLRFVRGQRVASLTVRVLLLVLLVAALSGVELTTATSQQYVVFAVDYSRSVADEWRETAAAFVDESLAHAGSHRVVVLPFATEAGRVAAGLPPQPPADRDQTDLAAAVVASAAAIPTDYVPQIVLLSDGNQTTGDALAAAQGVGVPVSTVPLPGRPRHEVYVSAIDAPRQAVPGERFDVDVMVGSTYAATPGDGQGVVRLRHGSTQTEHRGCHLVRGDNHFRFQQAVFDPGEVTLTAEIDGFADTLAGNNRAAVTVRIGDRPRALLVEGHDEQAWHLLAALADEGVDVEACRPQDLPRRPDALQARLEEHGLLMLCGVPATALTQRQMATVRKYIEELGGGLIAIGGYRTFSTGDYQGTDLENVLPVFCDVRRELRKLAMVLLIDRSKSMNRGSKIQSVRKSVRQVVGRLGPLDMIGVIAYDYRPDWVCKLCLCSDADDVLRAVDAIQCEGGTDMLPALEMAQAALDDAPVDAKHILVLTDGRPSPDRKTLTPQLEAATRKIAAAGITVSTVAVGEDAEAEPLQVIAEIGRGQTYDCPDPADVPESFALEAVKTGKLGITEGLMLPLTAEPAAFLADLDFRWAPPLLGYVQTRVKPDGHVILASIEGDPLLAQWQFGRGTTIAFTSGVHGDWGTAWRWWSDFGRFWGELVRHAVRRDTIGEAARVRRVGGDIGYADECRVRPADEDLLRRIAELTGGRYDPDPAAVFAPSQRTVPRTTSCWSYLLTAAVLLFVLDVALKRIDLKERRV